MNIKLKRHVYTSKGEKIQHFLIGLFGWVIAGTLVFYIPLLTGLIWIAFLLFIGLFAYFTLTKYWFAVGLLTNILINLILSWWLYGRIFSFDSIESILFNLTLTLPFPLYWGLSLMT